MKFEDLLKKYEQQLVYVNRMTNPDTLSFYHKTKEYWEGYLDCCFNWFERVKEECEDFKPTIREAKKEEREKYKYITKSENNEKEWPLEGVLEYRGEAVPVYSDDDGQQLFIIFQGEEISGGCYNTQCVYDFCYMIDKIKDLKKEA